MARKRKHPERKRKPPLAVYDEVGVVKHTSAEG
jgi:hypothetical protein